MDQVTISLIVDITIAAIVIISALIGMMRGLIREILSLVAWVLATWIAYRFCVDASVYLEPYIKQPPIRVVAGFTILFLGVLILVSFVNYLIYRLLSATGVTGTDRLLGAAFGIVRGAIIVAVLILWMRFMAATDTPWWLDAKLPNIFTPLVEALREFLPPDAFDKFADKLET